MTAPSRRSWVARQIETLVADLRLGVRRLRQEPGFTAVALLTLGLGIGATTAIFTLVDAVLLASLPVAHPAELLRLGDKPHCCVTSSVQEDFNLYSFALYEELRARAPEMEPLAAFQSLPSQHSVRRQGSAAPAQPLAGELVSGNYFPLLGIRAAAGRLLGPADDAAGAPPVLVLSYRAWQVRYALDPAIVGGTVLVDTRPFTVAGVAPPGFFGDTLRPDPPDFWLPLASDQILSGEGTLLHRAEEHWLYLMGRRRPGISVPALQAKLTAAVRHWLSELPSLEPSERQLIGRVRVTLSAGGAGINRMRSRYADGLLLLLAVAGLVLLIACANVANLLLTRGAGQAGQTAVRLALGAARGRLLRQSLTESLLLALAGGAAGVLLAVAATRAILALAFRGSVFVPISPLPSVAALGFALLLSVVTGALFGIVPAWMNSHSDPADALRGGRRASGDASSLPQRGLIVLQVAVSVVLLVGAGLLSRSLEKLEHQDFGFDTTGRLVVEVDPHLAGYTADRLDGLYRRLLDRLGALPGVRGAGLALYSPLLGNWDGWVFLPGRAFHRDEDIASWDRISPGFCETIGQRVVRGRAITDQDTATSRTVALVNQAFVKKFLPGVEPLGHRFGVEGPSVTSTYEIVGVVSDAKYYFSDRPVRPMYFTALSQPVVYQDPSSRSAEERSRFIGAVALRTAGDPGALAPTVRRTLGEIDPDLTVIRVRTFADAVGETFNQERLVARLTALFGLLALILAAIGLYGVTAYAVARRTNEIGIRLALGARRGAVMGLVLRRVVLQTGLGLAIGIPAALAAGRLVAHQLYEVSSWDGLTLAMAVAVLAASALAAGLIPAQRAAAVDPVTALR